MKFMKLGTKPDAFQQADRSGVRFVSSELPADVVISINEVKFHLHKFPLLSKSNKMERLISKSTETSDEIQLLDFPGGPKAFEICAKFCYGMEVTLNPHNVVAARCAAEFLEMTEDADRGNLIFKIEVFLSSSILRSWKDSIIVLQTTKSLLPWSENLKVVGRCIDSIASKTSVDPSLITWSFTYNRKPSASIKITQTGINLSEKLASAPKDWWVEDVCELDIDLFKRVIMVIKSKGRMDGGVIGEALRTYLARWLHDSVDALVSESHIVRNKYLVENIIRLLPSDKDVSCSCSFLLKLLKFAVLIGADDLLREDLSRSIGFKLEEACVNDLLIPARPRQTTMYDVELVLRLVNQYVRRGNSERDLIVSDNDSKNDGGFVLAHASMLKVGKVIDGYLAEIAPDPNFSVVSFIELSQSIPKSARPIHDRLYGAVDVYLKEHPDLTKAEKKHLCGIMDVKKLTRDVSMQAAQNERLPLRVAVQVLFLEQARAAPGVHSLDTRHQDDILRNNKGNWTKSSPENYKSLPKQMDGLKIKEESLKTGKLAKNGSKNSGSAGQLLRSRSRRIFDKLWIVGKGLGNGDHKSSETSASSQSPISMIQGEAKSSSWISRYRRYSIS